MVWLPDTYQANDDKSHIAERVPTRAECGLTETGFVFCCFNDTFKWMRLLAATANSVLWLLGTNPIAERNLRREAERRGIAADRGWRSPIIWCAIGERIYSSIPCPTMRIPPRATLCGLDCRW